MEEVRLIKKLQTIKDLADECLINLSASPESPHKKTVKEKVVYSSDYILKIVNEIKNCEESEKIETRILDKSGIPGRVLLPFYICYKYFPEQNLTTGDIEKITGELRVKIKTPNVSKAITESLQKYLDGDSTRVQGKAVSYRLNRKGAKYFESLIEPNEKI